MELLSTPETQIKLGQARRLMNEAIEILDSRGNAADVAAHLGLALSSLEDHLGLNAPGLGAAQDLRAALEKGLRGRESSPPDCGEKPDRFDTVHR